MNNPKRWYDEILAALVLVPALIIFIPYATFKYSKYNFKINKRDTALLMGYIFCCITVLWLVWSIG